MAGKKRKSADSATPRQTPASTRPSQRIKPSVELVEISSDEPPQPALGGVLRGLSLNNVLPTPKTQQSVELDDDDDGLPEPDKENRHMTRGQRYGRTDNPLNNDAKYHPMDEVTRPRNAAQRRSGSRSASALREQDRETSEASVPSSARGSEDESSQEEEPSDVEQLPSRVPDPRATRHSTRAAANKPVNYSRKHHPQDNRLPGHQHKAEKLSREMKKHKRSTAPASPKVQIPRAFKSLEDGVVICDSEDEEPELEPDEPSRPHKKLRTLSDTRSSPQKPRRKQRSPKKSNKAVIGQSDPLVDTMQEIEDYLDGAFAGGDISQGLASSDKTEAVQNLNGLVDSAEMSSSTGLDLAKVLAKEQRPIAGVDTFASDGETEADPEDFADQTQSQDQLAGGDELGRSGPRGYHDGNDDISKEDEVSDREHRNPGSEFQRLSQPKAASAGDTSVEDTPGSDAEGRDTENRSSSPEPHSDTGEPSAARFTSFGRVLGSDGMTGSNSRQGARPSVPSAEGDLQEAQREALKRPQSGSGLYNSANRKASSSTRTFGRSSTRVESSSSVLKTSSRVNSRVNSTQRATGDNQPLQAEEDAPVRQNNSLTRSKNEGSVDHDSESTGGDVEDGGQNAMASSSKCDLAGGSEENSTAQYGNQGLRPSKPSNGQTVSPATSFDENAAQKLADTAMWEQQRVAGSTVPDGRQVRFQVSREDSRASLQSPAVTPERSTEPARPSQRNRSDILFSSDPSNSPIKEPSDPASSTGSSSPSKFLDEKL